MRAIQGTDGKWYVVDQNDNEVAGPFETEKDALDWIEQNTPKPPPRPRSGP